MWFNTRDWMCQLDNVLSNAIDIFHRIYCTYTSKGFTKDSPTLTNYQIYKNTKVHFHATCYNYTVHFAIEWCSSVRSITLVKLNLKFRILEIPSRLWNYLTNNSEFSLPSNRRKPEQSYRRMTPDTKFYHRRKCPRFIPHRQMTS